MRIVIIDDHPLVRKGLAALLGAFTDIEVVGEQGDVQQAVELIAQKKPDIVCLDLRLGGQNGLDVASICRNRGLMCKFVVVTSSSEPADFRRAQQLGVDGYILKDALPEELVYAIRLVERGRIYYDPAMIDSLAAEKALGLGQLTAREMEVLTCLGRGLKNGEIANELYLTEFTIKKYVSQILDKLDLKDRTQAALYAVHNGLIQSDVARAGFT